jgi:hypothetical protein
MRLLKTSLIVLFFVLCYSFVLATNRPMAVAGTFYPDNPDEIRNQIKQFLKQTNTKFQIAPENDLIAIIVPHAGWIYSGKTAVSAFKAIKDQNFDQTIFIGVDHRTGKSTIGAWPDGCFKTPSGKITIDEKLTKMLLDNDKIIVADKTQHTREHSLEVLLPFFQYFFPDKKAAFLSCSGPLTNAFSLGSSLKSILEKLPGKTLLIVSTDWSHYHSAKEAKELDMRAIDSVLQLNSKKLVNDCQNNRAELCGIHGVIATIEIFKNASASTKLLERTDSSEASNDTSKVVGYASIVIQASKSDLQNNTQTFYEKETNNMSFEKEALEAARKTLEKHLRNQPAINFKFNDSRFEEKRGVFVTLKKNGELRGCIGFIQGVEPLKNALPKMAVSAATKDPRFKPVTYEELDQIKIEISVLSELVKVNDISEIEIGRDGLLLQLGGNSGLLLPQVPVEWNWDLKEYLKNLCYKAGLPAGSYQHPQALLQRFSAQVFGEE